MMRPSRSLLRPVSLLAVLAAVTLGGLAASGTPGAHDGNPPVPGPKPRPVLAMAPAGGGWKEVDRLVGEHKMQAALDVATKLRQQAQQGKDDSEWARGLIREVQLRMALHGYETAVRFLRDQPWPSSPLPHALLELFYADTLTTYERVYAWEIGRREEVTSTKVVDLKQWTRQQIYEEAQRAFLAVWKQRASWGDTPVSVASEFIAVNDYPPGVRGTLRDAVSYLYAE